MKAIASMISVTYTIMIHIVHDNNKQIYTNQLIGIPLFFFGHTLYSYF